MRTLLLALLLTTSQAWAQVGWQELHLPGSGPEAAETTVALWYPSKDPAARHPRGPFTIHAALNGRPADTFKGLLLLSHGTGGSELGHAGLAEALARHGYLVAALRHPLDNWQQNVLMKQGPPGRFFRVRPRQASQVLDALLRDPRWKDRIPSDARGLRIGALGHSAGGYTVLALAGGEPDPARIQAHCRQEGDQDPLFCSMGGPEPAAPGTVLDMAPLKDGRVRAVAALAPVGVVFTPESLAAVRTKVSIWVGAADRWLVPRFHGAWAAGLIPGAEFHSVPNAWHFAFMDTPSMRIDTLDGDIAADPPGFDRQAFLTQLGKDLISFFDRAWVTP
jgi:predicted dienelactone hydrolase